MADQKPNQQVLKSDIADRLIFQDILESSAKIQQLAQPVVEHDVLDKEGKRRFGVMDRVQDDPATALCRDVFSSLYRIKPETREDAPSLQKQLVESLLNLPEYRALHAETQTNDVASAMGLLDLAPNLLEQFEQVREKIEEKKKQEKQSGKPGDQKGSGGESLESLSEEEQSAFRGALRSMLRDAQENAEEIKELLKSWGVEPGELSRIPMGDKLKLIEKLKNTKQFHDIADIAGRLQNVQNSVMATSFQHGQDEIVDVELGSDISRMLPTEMMKYSSTPALFFKDFLEGNLLQYQMQGTEKLGRGPIINCFDISGSMAGGPFEWCKAATLSLMDVCKKQKRGFGAIAFESKIVYSKYWAKGQQISIQDRLDIAEMSTSGGTNFMHPLRAAFEYREREKDFRPADIVFVTDGAMNLKPEEIKWIEEMKKKTSTRIFGIAVDPVYASTLSQFCDEFVVVQPDGTVESMEAARKLFNAVTAR